MSLQKKLEESWQRLRDLRAEEQLMREASTAFRLEKNAREQREEVVRSIEIEKEVNNAIAAEGLSASEIELTELIKESIHNEQSLSRRVGQVIPEKFIRADAAVHFRVARDKAQNRIDELLNKYQSKGASLGPRVREEISECEAIVNAWDKNKPVYEMAERVHCERVDRQTLIDERTKLETARRQRITAL